VEVCINHLGNLLRQYMHSAVIKIYSYNISGIESDE